MAVAVQATQEVAMYKTRDDASGSQVIRESGSSVLADLLHGYRFRVCESPEDAAQALAIRDQVYNAGCGYDVPVPDDYDRRSWLLLAEDLSTGRAIGTMRLTPRAAGRLEAEEYFRLPLHLRSARALELNRFAILPGYRKGKTFLPAVSCGLFKLVQALVPALDARYMVVCSKAERMWTYEWLGFQRTGLVTHYAKLQNAAHELLWADFGKIDASLPDHPFAEFFGRSYPEVVLPVRIPELDLAIAASQPLRRAVGA